MLGVVVVVFVLVGFLLVAGLDVVEVFWAVVVGLAVPTDVCTGVEVLAGVEV